MQCIGVLENGGLTAAYAIRLRMESTRASSLRVLSGHEARRSSFAFLARKGMRNAGRFTAPAAPRVVGHMAPCTCGGARRCVALRFTRSRANLHRLERDGLGNRNTLRSAHNDLVGLQLPAAPWPGALTECGASALLGPWAAHPRMPVRPFWRCDYLRRKPAYATGPSHPLRAVTYTASFN